jgi:hypothetical protein
MITYKGIKIVAKANTHTSGSTWVFAYYGTNFWFDFISQAKKAIDDFKMADE